MLHDTLTLNIFPSLLGPHCSLTSKETEFKCENRVHGVFSKTHDYRISNFVSHFSIRSVCNKHFLSYCTLQGFPCEKQQQTLFHRVRDDTGNKMYQVLCLPGVHGFPGTRELGDLYSLPLFCRELCSAVL